MTKQRATFAVIFVTIDFNVPIFLRTMLPAAASISVDESDTKTNATLTGDEDLFFINSMW